MDDCSGDQEPLQMILNLDQTVALLEKVTLDLSSCNYSSVQPSIISLSFNLKRHGPSLELHHGELLLSLQKVLRSSCRDTKLDLVSRVHLLEIIEMRSAMWAPSHHITEFYKIKLEQIKRFSGSSPGTSLAGSSAEASSSVRTISSPTQSNVSKPSSRLNANAPDFCLGTSHLLKNISNTSIPILDTFVPNQPSIPAAFPPKPNVLHPDSPAFISRHQPSFHHSPLVTYSEDNLKSNPVNNQSMDMEEDDNDGSGDLSKKEDNSKNVNSNIFQCDKMVEEPFNVQSDNSSKYKATVHTEKGDIFMTSFSVDLLRTAQQLLEDGLKD